MDFTDVHAQFPAPQQAYTQIPATRLTASQALHRPKRREINKNPCKTCTADRKRCDRDWVSNQPCSRCNSSSRNCVPPHSKPHLANRSRINGPLLASNRPQQSANITPSLMLLSPSQTVDINAATTNARPGPTDLYGSNSNPGFISTLDHGSNLTAVSMEVDLFQDCSPSSSSDETATESQETTTKINFSNQRGQPSIQAAINGSENIVTELSETGVKARSDHSPNFDIGLDGGHCHTPLSAAIIMKHLPVVRLLLENGASPSKRHSREVYSPIHAAVLHGPSGIPEILLQYGADPNSMDDDLNTPLHIAASIGSQELCKLLLNYKASVLRRNAKQESALDLAACRGHMRVAALLINRVKDYLLRSDFTWLEIDTTSLEGRRTSTTSVENDDVVNNIGETGNSRDKAASEIMGSALVYAASRGRQNMVELLLDEDADPNFYWKQAEQKGTNHTLCTALASAAAQGNVEIVKTLLQKGGAQPAMSWVASKKTPLQRACENGHLGVIDELLPRLMTEQIDAVDADGYNALHIATRAGQAQAIRRLLDYPGHSFDFHRTSAYNQNMAHLAARSGNTDTLCLVMEHEVNLTAFDSEGRTPLWYACSKNNIENVKRLMARAGYGQPVHRHGETPLHAAALGGHVPVLHALLGAGIDVNSADDDGVMPLLKAVEDGNNDAIQYLLKQRANIRGSTEDCKITAIEVAALYGRVEAIETLLSYGAPLNGYGGNHSTPLIAASTSGDIEIVLMLIAKGADVNYATSRGRTALIEACEEGHEDVVAELLKAGANI